ncbi:MAG: DUF4333 domain-containing protein [Solirubrobacterales bacterium]|nr:DUF4333 domain-containing protein [Solirubrobacterales bacterium]
MEMNLKTTSVAAVTGLVAVLAFAGCSKTVDSGDLEGQLAEQLAPQLGTTKDQASVDCPDDEKAEKGNTFTCTFTDDKSGQSIDVEVTMTNDDGQFTAKTVGQPTGG